MDQKNIKNLLLVLLAIGLAVYGIISYLKLKLAAEAPVVTDNSTAVQPSGNTTVNTIPSIFMPGKTNDPNKIEVKIPGFNPFVIDISKKGVEDLPKVSFPIKIGSRGIEVADAQKKLNAYTKNKGLLLADIPVNGTWDQKTDDRFHLLFPYLTSTILTKEDYQKLF